MSDEPILFEGFDRVVINYEGEAVPMRRAIQMGILPEVGYMRNDGWSLAAPKELEDVAFRMWSDSWTHVIRKPQTYWTKL